jgi:hypothetical protein
VGNGTRRLFICAAFLLALGGPTYSVEYCNDGCGCDMVAAANALDNQAKELVSRLKAGDCSVIPTLQSLERQHDQMGRQYVAKYGYCGATYGPMPGGSAVLRAIRQSSCKNQNSCVVAEKESATHCINNDSVTVQAINNCGVDRQVKICLETRKGKLECGGWQPVSAGRSTDFWICQGTGRYSVQTK